MVGESGTSRLGRIYYYYSCLAKRRKQHPCKLKSVDKQWLEDIVINSTWALLGRWRHCQIHCRNALQNTRRNKPKQHGYQKPWSTTTKRFESNSKSYIRDWTRYRHRADKNSFERTRSTDRRTWLWHRARETTQLYISFTRKRGKVFDSIICGDIQEMPVRKLIVKAFVREVILDNDNVTITYNFTENYTKYRVTQEIIQKVQRQSRKKTAYNKNLCSYKFPPLPPSCTQLNP